MSSTRDQQLQQARELDRLSTVLVNVGVNAVKRNPIKVSLYFVGLFLCLLFNGFTIKPEQKAAFEKEYATLDYVALDEAAHSAGIWTEKYHSSKGWFSCDDMCKRNKAEMESAVLRYKFVKNREDEKVSNAKSAVGIFSEYGVAETRGLFWQRFSQGKAFATRQSKWDALWLGMSAMGRDENLINYILRLVFNVLCNFTLGVCGAVIAFIYSLHGLIEAYKASFLTATTFFTFAALAAMSFALTWLVMLYAATAGTVYVGAKFIASNMRLEGGQSHRPRTRLRHDE